MLLTKWMGPKNVGVDRPGPAQTITSAQSKKKRLPRPAVDAKLTSPEKGGGPHFRNNFRDSGGGWPLAAAGPVDESPSATTHVRLGVGPAKAVFRTWVSTVNWKAASVLFRCGFSRLDVVGCTARTKRYGPSGTYDETMSRRPTRFEHNRYLGDKRTQVVYDLDDASTPAELIDELVASEMGATFGPDTLPEARNRNYRLFRPRR